MQRAYVYDPLNRLLQGDFVARNASAPNTLGLWKSEEDNYRLSFASYNDNGSILSLRRRGLLAGSTRLGPKQYGPVDELTYAYAGNRLLAVEDVVHTNETRRVPGYGGRPRPWRGTFRSRACTKGRSTSTMPTGV